MFGLTVTLAAVAALFHTPSSASALVRDVSPMYLFPRTSCSASLPLSCHNTTVETNLCCFEAPGGSILQVQFWDTSPSTGPSNSWTIHGLWPDHCDNTYSEDCDPSRYYSSITDILTNAGATDVLDFMQTYWISDDSTNEAFWEHEWNTHGTCYSTLEPACISSSVQGQDAVYFFTRVVNLFQTLNTYEYLSSQGITPSSSKTYTLSALQSALKTASGYTPALTCDSSALNQISWYFNLQGSLIDGTFVPYDAPSGSSDCPSSGITYPPKTGESPAPSGSTSFPISSATSGTTSSAISSKSTTKSTQSSTTLISSSSTTTTLSSPAPSSLPSKSNIHISTGTGCLLSYGTWSTQTCATFTISGTSSGLTLTSSKGNCAISSGSLTCASSVSTATTFTAVSSEGQLLLAYSGSTAFSASSVPSGEVQETVYTGSGEAQDFSLIIG